MTPAMANVPSTTNTASAVTSPHPSVYDLSALILPYLDRHMCLPILEFLAEKRIYQARDLQSAKVEFAAHTAMIDFWASEYAVLHGKQPDDAEARRSAVYSTLESAQSALGPLLSLLTETATETGGGGGTEANRLRERNQWTVSVLSSEYGVSEAHLDALFRYGKLSYECGRYGDCATFLHYYRLLMIGRDDDKAFWALWGKLAAEILMANFDSALLDMTSLNALIDARTAVDQLEQLQQRTWIAHWSLFIYSNLNNGRNLMIDFIMQDKMLNVVQLNSPHLLRYVTAAVILNKRRKNILKELVRLIQSTTPSSASSSSQVISPLSLSSSCATYTDPLVDFLLSLYVDFDFVRASKQLKLTADIVANDFFLHSDAPDIMANARALLFETSARVHSRMNILQLNDLIDLHNTAIQAQTVQAAPATAAQDETVNTDNEAQSNGDVSDVAESALVSLIRGCGVTARIDSLLGELVLSSESVSSYQAVIDKTKSIAYRSIQMKLAVNKRLQMKRDGTEE